MLSVAIVCDRVLSFVNKVLRSFDGNVSHNPMVSQRAALQAVWYQNNQLSINFYTCVSFGKISPVLDPSPVTQRQGQRVQDHLSAHARRLVSFLANGYCACVHLA